MYKELYRAEGLPVLQNRVFETREAAINSPQGDVLLVEDSETGIIYNHAFLPELITYDANYHNEQEGSSAFREHLEKVASIIENYLPGKVSLKLDAERHISSITLANMATR